MARPDQGWIDIVVMQLVHRVIERPMDEAVHGIEMQFAEQRNEQQQDYEIDRC
jgi:hypothetical protein